MYKQRDRAKGTKLAGLWQPRVLKVTEGEISVRAQKTDSYVVVDEIIGDEVRLAVARWPQVDEDGRLRFDRRGSEPHGVGRAILQSELDRRRSNERQLPRPLRIGDAFLIRGFGDKPEAWARVLDVTNAARGAAKLAAFRPIAQHITEAAKAAKPSKATAAKRSAAPAKWRRPARPKRAVVPSPPAEPSAGSVAHPAV